MKPSVIVWDLETVPDLSGFAAANYLVGKTDADIRAVLGNKFPKHIYHTIVCIGALVAHREPDRWAVGALGAPHVGERTEKQLISAFCEKIAELTPQLVTFNGNTFDLPALQLFRRTEESAGGSDQARATRWRHRPAPDRGQ
jgi:3'-5' exonuclease